MRRARIAHPDTPRATLPQPVRQDIAAAIDHGVLDAVGSQDLHPRCQNRELGDAPEIKRHALSRQKRGARLHIQKQAARVYQGQLACDLRGGGQSLIARAKVPRFERTHSHVKRAARDLRHPLRALQHDHDFIRHRDRRDTGGHIDVADHTARLVSAHERFQPLHLQIGLFHTVAQQNAVCALHHHIDLRPHQCPGVPERR